MRFVITVKDHGIPVMEIAVSLVKSEPVPESVYELDYPEEFQPVDEEWEKRIEDYYTNGPPSNWDVKLTKQQIRYRSMESYGNTIAMGDTKPEQWIYSYQYGWMMKQTIEEYEYTKKYPTEIKIIGEKILESGAREFNEKTANIYCSRTRQPKTTGFTSRDMVGC